MLGSVRWRGRYGACIAGFGCPEILACIDESGCAGVACFFTCSGVIQEFGGLTGNSMARTVELNACALDYACPCD